MVGGVVSEWIIVGVWFFAPLPEWCSVDDRRVSTFQWERPFSLVCGGVCCFVGSLEGEWTIECFEMWKGTLARFNL